MMFNGRRVSVPVDPRLVRCPDRDFGPPAIRCRLQPESSAGWWCSGQYTLVRRITSGRPTLEIALRCAAAALYGGIGIASRSARSSGASQTAAQSPAPPIPQSAAATEMPMARRLIFFSRAFSVRVAIHQASVKSFPRTAPPSLALRWTSHTSKQWFRFLRDFKFAAPAIAGCLAVTGAALAGM